MKSQRKNIFWLSLLAVLLLVLGQFISWEKISEESHLTEVQEFSTRLKEAQEAQSKSLEKLNDAAKENKGGEMDFLFFSKVKTGKPEGATLLVYRGENLVYWSDNHTPVMNSILPRRNYSDEQVLHLGNG